MVLQTKQHASTARIAAAPVAPGIRTPPPPTHKGQVTTAPLAKVVPPTASIVQAAPLALPVGQPSMPFTNLRTEEPETTPRTVRRQHKSGRWWKGPMFAFAVLVVAATVVYFKWDSIASLIPDDDDAVAQNSKGKDSVVEPSPKRKPTKPVSAPARNPNKDKPPAVPNPPPKKDPTKRPPQNDTVKNDPPRRPPSTRGSLFPRRALLISVHDYLFANPLQNGPNLPHASNFTNLINDLANGMDVPLNQIAHLSDEAGPKWGARAPTKAIIEKTLTNFLDSSRPQDRIMVFFAGHSVELGDDVYLAPIEGELNKADTLMPLKWFYEQLAKCKARQKVLVLDINRYNQTFGEERPGSAEMGDKLDALLTAPPPGVQVWSSCSPKQRSYASDEYPMGIFLDSLEMALKKGLQGQIQKGEQSLPLERYVERVNQIMKDDLSKRKLEQVSRLTGKEPDEGAAYDPKQPPAAEAVASLARPPAEDGLNKMLIETVLDQVGTPPVKVTHEMALRYDALPPFSVEALQKYQGDTPNPESPLRKAVQNARVVLWAIYPGSEPEKLRNEVAARRGKIGVQLTVLKDGYRAPAGGNAEKQFKDRVENDERRVALLIRAIEDALDELQAEPVKEARGSESKRWQANYDFILARMELEYAYLFEYQSMLGSMRKELPPRDAALHGGWKLASQGKLQGDSKGKKSAASARKLLTGIIKNNAGSPWEVLAKREMLTNLGLEWQPTR
jgi:hypothetical protein